MAVIKTKIDGQWVEVPVVANNMVKVAQTETSVTLKPNTYNTWANPITTLTLQNPSFEGTDEYVLDFTTGETIDELILSPSITFIQGFYFLPHTHYVVSIVNNMAVGGAF